MENSRRELHFIQHKYQQQESYAATVQEQGQKRRIKDLQEQLHKMTKQHNADVKALEQKGEVQQQQLEMIIHLSAVGDKYSTLLKESVQLQTQLLIANSNMASLDRSNQAQAQTIALMQHHTCRQTVVIEQLERRLLVADNVHDSLQNQLQRSADSLAQCQSSLQVLQCKLDEEQQSNTARSMRELQRQLKAMGETAGQLGTQVQELEAEKDALLYELQELHRDRRLLQQSKSKQIGRAVDRSVEAVRQAQCEVNASPVGVELPLFVNTEVRRGHRMFNSKFRRMLAKLYENGVPASKTGMVADIVLRYMRICQLSAVPSPATCE